MAQTPEYSVFEALIEGQFSGPYAARYNRLEEWSSMQSLIVISVIDEHYDVILNHETLKEAANLRELHAIVCEKIK